MTRLALVWPAGPRRLAPPRRDGAHRSVLALASCTAGEAEAERQARRGAEAQLAAAQKAEGEAAAERCTPCCLLPAACPGYLSGLGGQWMMTRACPPGDATALAAMRGEVERGAALAARAGAVSRSCACIGSPCLRYRVHGASIGGGGVAGQGQRARPAARAAHRGSQQEEGGGGEGGGGGGGGGGRGRGRGGGGTRAAAAAAGGEAERRGAGGGEAGGGARERQGGGQGGQGGGRADGGESFLRVHWVAVPEALRARRVNRPRGAPRRRRRMPSWKRRR
jgi:hypothetical protein